MLNKTKIYQILTFSFMCLSIILLLILGITAVQKSMRLKLGFNMEPSIYCYIEYKAPSEADSEYKPLFSNVTNTGAGLTPSVTANASLSGNTLTLTTEFEQLGTTFDFRIYNYNNFALKVTCAGLSKSTSANTSAANVATSANPIIFTSITTGGGNIVFSFEEYTASVATFSFNGGKFNTNTQATLETTSLPATLSSEYIPTREGYTFAGYYSEEIDPKDKPSNSAVQYYSYSYLADTPTLTRNVTLSISNNITLHARWLPFTIGTYASGLVDTAMLGQDVIDVWSGYKYIVMENHETQETAYNLDENGDGIYQARYVIIGANDNTNLGNAVQNTTELAENEILVMSEGVLFESAFDSDDNCSWAESDIRTKLRDEFMPNSGLSLYSTNYISQKTLQTSYGIAYNTYETCTSTDKIFLLGHVLDGQTQTFCVETYLESDYKISKYMTFGGSGTGNWWLRTGAYVDPYEMILTNHSPVIQYVAVGGNTSLGVFYISQPLGGLEVWESSTNNISIRPCFVLNLA